MNELSHINSVQRIVAIAYIEVEKEEQKRNDKIKSDLIKYSRFFK